jgi:hypothetical protein
MTYFKEMFQKLPEGTKEIHKRNLSHNNWCFELGMSSEYK